MKKQYFIELPGANRIRVEFDIIRGKVGHFIIQLEVHVKEKWNNVVRYNYSHGFPHRDLVLRNGRKIKEKINETDLGKVANFGINDLKTNWLKYLRRCGYE